MWLSRIPLDLWSDRLNLPYGHCRVKHLKWRGRGPIADVPRLRSGGCPQLPLWARSNTRLFFFFFRFAPDLLRSSSSSITSGRRRRDMTPSPLERGWKRRNMHCIRASRMSEISFCSFEFLFVSETSLNALEGGLIFCSVFLCFCWSNIYIWLRNRNVPGSIFYWVPGSE